MSGRTAFEEGLRLGALLDTKQIPYALGGALAYGVWSQPRGTMDVDLNLFVAGRDLQPAVDVLVSAGVKLGPDAIHEAQDGGQFLGWSDDCRIDVFTPSIPFSWEAMRTRVRADFQGQSAWFLSAEALCVFKLMFFRTKDIVDMERMIALRGPRLDATYVRRWISETMGEDDPRVLKWDELVREFGTR